MNMEKILQDFGNLSLGRHGSSSLNTCIRNALERLAHQKSKKTSFEVLKSCVKHLKTEGITVIIDELKSIIKEQVPNKSIKILLVLLESQNQIKANVLNNFKVICEFLLQILIESFKSYLMDENAENEVSNSMLEERLFNGMKVCIHVLQNIDNKILLVAFQEPYRATWEKNWLEQLIVVLCSIIKCKLLQKETLNMAGIALAHVVNCLPSLNYAVNLTKVLLENSSINKNWDVALGPISIRLACNAGELSDLALVATVNGLLTVCSSELLLCHAHLEMEKTEDDEMLNVTFEIIYQSCSTSFDSESKYYSFQVLNMWLDTMSRITIKRYHSKVNKETLFMPSSVICEKLMELIFENREDLVEGVPKIVLSIFGKVLDLHKAEKSVLGDQCMNDNLIHLVLVRLLAEPWYIRGRCTLLCEVFRHTDPAQVVLQEPTFPASLCKSFSASNLVSAANECYKSFVASKSSSCSRISKFWDGNKWAEYFQGGFIDMLTDASARSTDNCVLYFIPTTILQIPGTFQLMKNIICDALHKEFVTDMQNMQEWDRIRRNLLFGYCAVLKLGRKFGLALLKDVNMVILEESLHHVNDDLRAEAFSVLCHNNKTTERISILEQSLIMDFLQTNMNCASSSFRQTVFVSMKVLLARLRDSSIMLLREHRKAAKKQRLADDLVHAPEALVKSIDLVENLTSLSLKCLFPCASFQRKKTGLQLFYAILETFSSPKDAVKRGRTAESVGNLTDWAKSSGKWIFITKRNMEIIVSCFEDQHDEIRELAFDILKWFDFRLTGMTQTDIESFGKKLMVLTLSLCSSPRIRDAESGAILFEFLSSRFIKLNIESIFKFKNFEDITLDSMSDPFKFDGLVHLMLCLLKLINKQIEQAYFDVLNAAIKQPVFGFVMATRRCFMLLLQQLSFVEPGFDRNGEHSKLFALLVKESANTCSKATDLALLIFKKQEMLKDGSPSFADMNDALDEAMRKCKSFEETKDLIGYQHCLEVMTSFCWLNVKAATLFLGDLGRVMTLECFTVCQRKEILPDEIFNIIGETFRETLVRCRHKGVIENSNVGFQKLCRSVSSITSLTKSLNDWLLETIEAVDRHDFNSSVTKRSAGLPMFLQPLISSCISSRRFSFGVCIEKLLGIAKRPLSADQKEHSDLPQVQAMNILKMVYRDSTLGGGALKYAEDGLILSIEGFSSPSWSVRNAAQILLGALVPRMFGQRVTQAEKSHHNSLSASKFFKTYPKLKDFFIKMLKPGVQCDRELKSLPSFIPVLTMLSKLRPRVDEKLQTEFLPLLKDLIYCPVFTVRKLAAHSLVLFMSPATLKSFIQSVVTELDVKDENFKHGFLLMVKFLIDIKEDDQSFAHCIPSNTVLDISNIFLHTKEIAKSHLSLPLCVLLEIYAILLPKLCRSSFEDDVLIIDYIKSALKLLIRKIAGDQMEKTVPEIGMHLALRRIAQVVVVFVVHMQNQDIGTSKDLITACLSTSCQLLLKETTAQLNKNLENGKIFKESLKVTIFSSISNKIDLLEEDEKVSENLDCCCNALKDIKDFDMPMVIASQLFNICINMSLSGHSHRRLSSILPFIGVLLKYFYAIKKDSENWTDFLELFQTWSEAVLQHSLPESREILRLGSLKAVQVSAEFLFNLYETRAESTLEIRCDEIASSCARLVFASLKLIQDEDEEIRSGATEVALSLQPTCPKRLRSKAQSNLAIKSIFKYAVEKMKSNFYLLELLWKYLIDLLNCNIHLILEQRSSMLFEQEGPNLLAEDLLFAEQIICSLEVIAKNFKICFGNIPRQYEALANMMDKKKGLIIKNLELFIDTIKDRVPNCPLALYGTSQRFVFLSLIAYTIPVIADSLSEDETEKLKGLLFHILKIKDLHPFLVDEFSQLLLQL